MRRLFNEIAETCDLPPLPAAAARALALARDPDTTADALARVVMTDGALAARVLTISRSVTYLRRQPPRTLQEAILTVGLQGLRKILIAASARSAYQATDATAQTLWAHALAAALAADEVAKTKGCAGSGDAFIAGLLHDVGKLVFHLADPRTFATLGASEREREQEFFGASHDAVGACLAEHWGLEDEVVSAIMFHHGGAAATPLAQLVADADRIATLIGYGSVANASPPGGEGNGAGVEPDPVIERVRTLFESERNLFE